MNKWYKRVVYENEEDRQLAHILSRLIWASWAAYLIVVLVAMYWGDLKVITVAITGSVFQAVPFWLLRRGHLHASSLIVVLSELVTVTIIATVGQGIHDSAMIAYTIIFIFAGLTLDIKFFRLCVGLTLGIVCWLVAGEANGWFVTQPFYEDPFNLLYLLVVIIQLIMAAFAVDLLATNLQKNLKKAHCEIEQRKKVEEQLRYFATHDALTGIYNRAFFETELARLEHSRDFPISIIIADVDKLKIANDTQGHAAGDVILRQTAQVLRSTFREGDIVARIGGDEFAALLPATDSTTVKDIVARVRQHLLDHNTEKVDRPIELSIGTATAEKDNLIEIFKLADQCMYADKTARKGSRNNTPVTDSVERDGSPC